LLLTAVESPPILSGELRPEHRPEVAGVYSDAAAAARAAQRPRRLTVHW
jgi:hypothetical protein